MTLAGATAAYTPRHILGAALAARASARISPRVAGIQQLGRKLEVAELRIEPASPLADLSLEEADIARRTGATVIAQWVAGELRSPLTADSRLVAGGIAVLVGSHGAIERFSSLCGGGPSPLRAGPFLVAGHGEVGQKVADLLRQVGEQVLVIDRLEGEGVDLVGDVLDQRVLEEAGLARSQALILALDSDAATLFATVIAKELAAETPVIARVNQGENVDRTHHAGADFALSISGVSGQMLARRLLGEDAVSIDPQLKVRRVDTAGLVGRHPAELRIRERTGCSVVAVERGDQVLVELGDEDFRFAEGDAVYVCGPSEAASRFNDLLGG